MSLLVDDAVVIDVAAITNSLKIIMLLVINQRHRLCGQINE